MSGVKIREGESFESLLKRFRKVVATDGILQDVKKYQYYEKPSEKKKKDIIASKRRINRKMKRNEE
ncbi:MAG TPA: 30S ribosomal protein S21 [Candidatus Hydrothermia bacterium]|nr:30S ribosomal protein S21 [Candidatus Hydrothermae bacterium]MDD3648806.1 30S ribosomal protein S21 [Candidatus Hydrothermia bacterium]MDD5572372.1 30S ribosomal protein S21 [Candidatus Hydrothermia bacterium]HOK23311.1 30S ribosomal protein S21 [Candidatus Hydrothermia bacterium]HOL24120.1 30S ribosomal protein S21 [Candidatus Hydrothermia bacterium]